MDSNEIRRHSSTSSRARHTVVPSRVADPVDPTLLLTNRRHGAVQALLLGERAARTRERSPSRSAPHRATSTSSAPPPPPHVLRDARQLQLRRLLQGEGHPVGLRADHRGFGIDPDRSGTPSHETMTRRPRSGSTASASADRVQRGDRTTSGRWACRALRALSEIFYDKGPSTGRTAGPVVDEERFIEIWNLVFMQNIQDEPYHVIGDLPAKNIDTGLGLERRPWCSRDATPSSRPTLWSPISGGAERHVNALRRR